MNETVLLLMLFLLLGALAGVRRVSGQRVRTLRRFGRYRRVLGPGWHWVVPGLDQRGQGVDLIGHHLHVQGPDQSQAELHFQIVEPEKAGETLDRVDDFVAREACEALGLAGRSPEQLKTEMNRRIGRLGLRVIRCSLHPG